MDRHPLLRATRMTRMTRMTRIRTLTLVAVAALSQVLPTPLYAQGNSQTAKKVIHACYVPSTGSVYRIKEPNTPSACDSKKGHVEFAWYEEGPEGKPGPIGPQGEPGPVGPAGPEGPQGVIAVGPHLSYDGQTIGLITRGLAEAIGAETPAGSQARVDAHAATSLHVPAGGTAGQALVKKSAADRDVQWSTVNGGTGAVAGWQRVVQGVSVPARSLGFVAAACPTGKRVLGGGYSLDLAPNLVAASSYPHENGTHWLIDIVNSTDQVASVFAYAICAPVAE